MKVERLKKNFNIDLSDAGFDPGDFFENEEGTIYMIIGFEKKYCAIEVKCGEVFELTEVKTKLARVDFKLVEVPLNYS